MKIDPEDERASLPRRWGLPLGVAAGVAALSFAAVAVLGGQGAAKPVLAAGDGNPTGPATAPASSPPRVASSPGAGSAPSSARATDVPFTVISTATTPIESAAVARILASCLGSNAGEYHPAIAVRTPVASQDWDGAVVAVDSAGQYVQCETKGDRGTSSDVPPTFINNRLWGTGHVVEYFDSTGEQAGRGRYLSIGAGHYTSDVARITISYGESPKEHPAVMAGGAFFYTAAFSTGGTPASKLPFSAAADPYVHAYNSAGKEIYNQKQDPRFTAAHK
ncbi:hypothetical protein [Phaeacidiphilus oryzae]|uniref:hypothetical protein n=1 Tax=Phaeacidiphilus oryzae TaxID=348818 RepID=UPI00056B64D4|nr:hypothetical protein [Phaeacidiphilus oryzae]